MRKLRKIGVLSSFSPPKPFQNRPSETNKPTKTKTKTKTQTTNNPLPPPSLSCLSACLSISLALLPPQSCSQTPTSSPARPWYTIQATDQAHPDDRVKVRKGTTSNTLSPLLHLVCGS